jgi:hypothetical protein
MVHVVVVTKHRGGPCIQVAIRQLLLHSDRGMR